MASGHRPADADGWHRIPIGYWAYDSSAGEPYVRANQSAYLSRAVGWAQAHNIKVMVDLHGLPGSQNGKQNSGHAGPINWPSAASNANRAAKIVQSIASDFSSNKGTVTHIELANEPVMERSNDIKSYTQSYYSSAAPQASEFSATLHDGFLPLSDWYGFDAGGDTNFVVDTHYYSMYPYYGNSGAYCSRLAACLSCVPPVAPLECQRKQQRAHRSTALTSFDATQEYLPRLTTTSPTRRCGKSASSNQPLPGASRTTRQLWANGRLPRAGTHAGPPLTNSSSRACTVAITAAAARVPLLTGGDGARTVDTLVGEAQATRSSCSTRNARSLKRPRPGGCFSRGRQRAAVPPGRTRTG